MTETQKKVKILFIDNDDMMRIYFRDIFWVYGRNDTYEVTTAASLEDAEKKIADKDTKPNLIFLDVMIPSIDKDHNSTTEQVQRISDFVARVKKDDTLADAKIIIFSDQKEELVKEEVSKYGASGYLIKGELMPKEIIDFTDKKIHECHN